MPEITGSLLAQLLPGSDDIPEGGEGVLGGHPFVRSRGLLRSRALMSAGQAQTSDMFGYKWGRRDTYESDVVKTRARVWLTERYGDIAAHLPSGPERPRLLDVGCGAGFSAMTYLGPCLDRVDYVGVDVSDAIDVARQRFVEQSLQGGFLQSDMTQLPFAPGSFDILFAEGVLHHTDSTSDAIARLAPLLKPGGRFLMYVYRRKGPIREFTDDYIRERIQGLPPEEVWALMMPLTRLGKTLGDMDITVDVPEDIALLDIPAGPISLQRLFYWHVFKAFHDPEMTLEEMNHINFDWYAPRNAHRQSPDEVGQWCAEAGLEVMNMKVEAAGITVVAQARG